MGLDKCMDSSFWSEISARGNHYEVRDWRGLDTYLTFTIL